MEQSKGSGKQTLVEEGTELKGTLKSSCHVVVNGSIDGQIEAPSLTVTDTGTVLGTVKAKQLRSEGTLAGDIDAEDVYLSGTVRSNTMIRAKKLEVKLSHERGKLEVTFGECLIEVGTDPMHKEEPAAAEAAAPAAAAVEEPMPAVAEPSKERPRDDDEPTWSEPPPVGVSPSVVEVPAPVAAAEEPREAVPPPPEAAASEEPAPPSDAEAASPDSDPALAAENALRRSRENHQRDSQAPPA